MPLQKRCFTAATIIIVAFWAANAGAVSVSVSILSVLKPQSIFLILKSPERATLKLVTPYGERRQPIMAGTFLELEAAGDLIREADSNDSFRSIELECGAGCRTLIEVRGKLSRVYRGTLKFSSRNSTINIILIHEAEELTASITASEMGEYAEVEAIRAFAVVARSFLLSRQRHPSLNADFCDTTHCQVFQGPGATGAIEEAVRSTAGIVLTYNQSAFRPFYSRMCGGQTSSFEDVWNEKPHDYPFYPVDCPCKKAPHFWTASLSAADLESITGLKNATIQLERRQILVRGDNQILQFTPEQFRVKAGRALGWKLIQANRFTIKESAGQFELHGSGIGHGVGLCQTGAAALAREGRRYAEILSYYFPNTELRTFKAEKN